MEGKPLLRPLIALSALMPSLSISADLYLSAMPAKAATTGSVVAFDATTDWGGLPGLLVPLFMFASANRFIVANSIAGALGRFPEVAASASAVQTGFGIAGGARIGRLADGRPRPMGFVIAVFRAVSPPVARLGARAERILTEPLLGQPTL